MVVPIDPRVRKILQPFLNDMLEKKAQFEHAQLVVSAIMSAHSPEFANGTADVDWNTFTYIED